jgi:hypothetical protein
VGGSQLPFVSVAIIVVTFAALEWREGATEREIAEGELWAESDGMDWGL